MLVAVATFVFAAVLIILLPGPDTLVVVRSILRGGRARGVATVAGIMVGLSVWVSAAALGLSALLRASEVGYDVLRFAGAAYLVWLGITAIRARNEPNKDVDDGRRGLTGTGFVAGLVTNLLNPKVGVFFVTFLPAFVPHGAPVGLTSLLFGGIFIVLTVGYFAMLIAIATKVTNWMSQPTTRRRLDTVTGGIFIAFGIRLATE